MRSRPSSYALGHTDIAAEHSVTGWQAGKTENCLLNASHAGKPSVGVFARVQIPFVSGAKCV
jgi:hypothetical protein